MNWKKPLTGLALMLAAETANAAGPAAIIRSLIVDIYNQIRPLVQALAILMFVYGGAKYAYSADDPGGRKQAKSICINALVGLIIVASARAIVNAAGGTV